MLIPPGASAARLIQTNLTLRRRTLTSWGAINAVLNRLVRDGVIAAFRTNVADRRSALGFQVIVTPAGVVDRARAEEVRRIVARALEPLIADAVVTVDRSGNCR